MPSDDSEPAYVIPFEQNGTDVDMPFRPSVHSSPREGWMETSFATSVSYTEARVGNSPIQRPMAGRRLIHRMWDTSSLEEVDNDQDEIEQVIGLPDRWAKDPFWFLKYIDDGLGGEKLCNAMP